MEVAKILKNENVPFCTHGPTVKFSSAKGYFYACSSCRNGECPVRINEEDWKDERVRKRNGKYKDLCIDHNNIDYGKLYSQVMTGQSPSCGFCFTCNRLFEEEKSKCPIDKMHSVKLLVKKQCLQYPTKWLPALSNDTIEAQYFFNENCIQILINALRENKIKKIVCIGAPTIHEAVKNNNPSIRIKTLLLDMDERFYNFNSPGDFMRYNMFNHHFFGGEDDIKLYKEYLKCNSAQELAIIMDPPFGGRVELLAYNLQAISNDFEKVNKATLPSLILPTFWVFPYFTEPHICTLIPEFKMHDYQVEYENHKKFKNRQANKAQGTPVRIFTNLPLSSINLSNDKNYKFCTECSKWVSKANQHCSICNDCTSKKHGMTYVHCMKCKKCVKPTYTHCDVCKKCCQKLHKCQNLVIAKSCYNCNKKGHKRVDCPMLNIHKDEPKRKKKRK